MRKIILLVVCVMLVGTASADLERAMKAANMGDRNAATKEFMKMAGDGDVKAMLTIGSYYFRGECVRQDYSRALNWFLKALDKKDPVAFNNVGVMFRDGLGVPRDMAMAYALIKHALSFARTSDAARLAKYNLEKVDTWITDDEYERAVDIIQSKITSKKILEVCDKPAKAGVAANPAGIFPGIWTRVPDKYALGRNPNLFYRNVKLSKVQRDDYKEVPGNPAFTFEPVKDRYKYLKDNVFSFNEGRFAITVPKLAGNVVEIHFSRISAMTHQVKFYEDKAELHKPWEMGPECGHAVVMTQILPDTWKGNTTQTVERIKMQQENLMAEAEIPANIYNCSLIDGKYGKAVQTIVFNRRSSAVYPQEAPTLFPFRNGVVTIGINRMLYTNGMIVELGLIIPKTKSMSNDAFVAHAVGAMEVFMSGFVILPR